MDDGLREKLTTEVFAEIREMNINLQANPTKALEAIINRALIKGWNMAWNMMSVTSYAGRIEQAYEEILETRLKASGTNRTERYRLQAELEDLEHGRWIGPRTDNPPDDWQG